MAFDPISAGLSVASLASGVFGSRSANKAAKRAANQQAMLTGLQRREELRKLREAADVDIGMARAQIGASNVLFSGSSASYLREFENEYDRQISFGNMARGLEQQAIKAGARGAGDSILASGVGDAVSYGIRAIMAPDKPSST